jgi:hypothetical protein
MCAVHGITLLSILTIFDLKLLFIIIFVQDLWIFCILNIKICSGMLLNTKLHCATSSGVKRPSASVRGITLLSILTIFDLKLLFIVIFSSRSMDILHSKYQNLQWNIAQYQATLCNIKRC